MEGDNTLLADSTDPAEATRIMSREGFKEDSPAKQNNCCRKCRIPRT